MGKRIFHNVRNYANLCAVSIRTIRFYRKANGDCPVESFLDTLPDKTAAKIVAVLKLVEQQPTLSNRVLRKLRGTELFEVRVLAETWKMSDIDRYVERRTRRAPEFATIVEQEYENLRIGELIRQLRQEHHMTQEELAKRLGTTKSAISRLENHADSIRLETLERVARVFDRKVKISIES